MARNIRHIQQVVSAAIEAHGGTWFHKREIVNEVSQDLQIASVLTRLNRMKPSWQLDEIFRKEIEGYITDYLQQTQTIAQTAAGPLTWRVYECYAAGERQRRWQRLDGMTADDLRVCIAARRTQVAGHQRVIRVYEALLAILEQIGPTATFANISHSDWETIGQVANQP